MKHIAAHRWAALQAGTLSASEDQALRAHALACAQCRTVRDRVVAGMLEFSAIAQAPAPELRWESTRTQIHWQVAAARRTDGTATPAWFRRRNWQLAALVPAVAAVAGVWLAVRDTAPLRSTTATTTAMTMSPTQTQLPAAATPVPLGGWISKVQGGAVVVNGERADNDASMAALFNRTISAGATVATADATLHIQFGPSGFGLAPHSTATLRRFDDRAVELVVDGMIDVEVTARAANQRFLIVAGTRTIEVRGTQFRVDHRSALLTVWCRHGHVVVADGARRVDVVGGMGVTLPDDNSGSAATWPAASPLPDQAMAMLSASTPVVAATIESAQQGSVLAINASPGRAVRVDGVDVGVGDMWLRSTQGRHRVEAGNAAGRFRSGVWVDGAAQPAGQPRVVVAALVRDSDGPDNDDARRIRQGQLRAGLNHQELAACVRAVAKQGFGDAFVALQIKVDSRGDIAVLNAVDSDLSATIVECVRTAISHMSFPAGPDVMWVERLSL